MARPWSGPCQFPLNLIPPFDDTPEFERENVTVQPQIVDDRFVDPAEPDGILLREKQNPASTQRGTLFPHEAEVESETAEIPGKGQSLPVDSFLLEEKWPGRSLIVMGHARDSVTIECSALGDFERLLRYNEMTRRHFKLLLPF